MTDYKVYKMDKLSEGSELQLDHTLAAYSPDISALITQSAEKLETARKDSMEKEREAFEAVQAAAEQWERYAKETYNINRALEYLKTPEVNHTENVWQANKNGNREEISNRVYKMYCDIWENTKYDRETKQQIPVAWYVTWSLRLNSPRKGYSTYLAGQRQKRYTDKAAAMKYIEGRKRAYAHLFTEISPPIPRPSVESFSVHGTLLPGYTVEE